MTYFIFCDTYFTMTQYKAEGMVDVNNGVMWGLTCVAGEGDQDQ